MGFKEAQFTRLGREVSKCKKLKNVFNPSLSFFQAERGRRSAGLPNVCNSDRFEHF